MADQEGAGVTNVAAAGEGTAPQRVDQIGASIPPSSDREQPTAADTPAPRGAARTLAGGGVEEKGGPGSVPADWPQDWRQKLAGEDKGLLKQLERLASPADLYKSYRALQGRLSSGEFKKALPENASPEQIAAWRSENGVPGKADEYVGALDLPQGVVPGEADKPLLASFAQAAHEHHWTPAQFNQAVAWYYAQQDHLAAQREEADDAFKMTAHEELVGEWGPEFRRNLNAMGNLLALAPEGVADRLLAGRMADGKLIGNDPGVLRFLVAVAREAMPAATLVPAGSGDQAKGVNDRIGEIEKQISNYRSDYWQGPKAAGLQQELRELYAARDKMKARAG